MARLVTDGENALLITYFYPYLEQSRIQCFIMPEKLLFDSQSDLLQTDIAAPPSFSLDHTNQSSGQKAIPCHNKGDFQPGKSASIRLTQCTRLLEGGNSKNRTIPTALSNTGREKLNFATTPRLSEKFPALSTGRTSAGRLLRTRAMTTLVRVFCFL